MTREERKRILVLAALAGKIGNIRIFTDTCSYKLYPNEICLGKQQESYLISSELRSPRDERNITRPAYVVIRPCYKHRHIWNEGWEEL